MANATNLRLLPKNWQPQLTEKERSAYQACVEKLFAIYQTKQTDIENEARHGGCEFELTDTCSDYLPNHWTKSVGTLPEWYPIAHEIERQWVTNYPDALPLNIHLGGSASVSWASNDETPQP